MQESVFGCVHRPQPPCTRTAHIAACILNPCLSLHHHYIAYTVDSKSTNKKRFLRKKQKKKKLHLLIKKCAPRNRMGEDKLNFKRLINESNWRNNQWHCQGHLYKYKTESPAPCSRCQTLIANLIGKMAATENKCIHFDHEYLSNEK